MFALAIASTALVVRAEHTTLQWTAIALTAIAVLPWIVDLLVIEVPPWLFVPAVVVPVAILHDPSRFDPLPLLLAVLALDMGLWLGLARSSPILLASGAVILLPIPETSDDPGWLGRPLTVMVVVWLVGLVLRSQTQRTAVLRRRSEALRHAVLHVHLPAARVALANARAALTTENPNELRRSLHEAEDHLDQLAARFESVTPARSKSTVTPHR